MTTYEKIVKGATKVKVAAPKLKYIEPILLATLVHHPTEIENFHTIMRTLHTRLRDSAWSVVYKSLIVIHIMIREGDKDFTLKYIGENMPNLLHLDASSVSRGTGMTSEVKFTMKYAKYLQTRVNQYLSTHIDYVRDERSNNSTDKSGGRLRKLSVEKGLLRESESVQKQIDALLKNNFMENDINNDVLLTSFRLLVNDLLALFQELNEGVINILEHYFEVSKVDAERALKIYKKFVDQTKYVVDYLRVAKHLEHATKLHVPTIKHAPTALTSSLEEYLDDPNFEQNRKQYLIERNMSKDGKSPNKIPSVLLQAQQQSTQTNGSIGTNIANDSSHQRAHSLIVQQSTYNPWEQQLANQQQVFHHAGGVFTMPSIAQGQEVNPNGFFQGQPVQQAPIQQVPAQPIQMQNTQLNPVFTGNGFGGYGPQTQQVPQQATGNNPFLQSMNTGQQQQPTQQFVSQPTQTFIPQQMQQQVPTPTQQQQSLQNNQQIGLQRSNTNPFSVDRSSSMQMQSQSTNPFASTRFALGSGTTALSLGSQKPEPIKASATGSNPFKVSQTTTNLFDNATKNQKQPQAIRPQPTAGGLENLPTVPIFPETQKEQQKQQYLQQAQTGLQQMAFQQQRQFQQQPFQPQFTQQQPGQFPQQQPPQQFPFGQAQQPVQNGMYANNTYNGPSLI